MAQLNRILNARRIPLVHLFLTIAPHKYLDIGIFLLYNLSSQNQDHTLILNRILSMSVSKLFFMICGTLTGTRSATLIM